MVGKTRKAQGPEILDRPLTYFYKPELKPVKVQKDAQDARVEHSRQGTKRPGEPGS